MTTNEFLKATLKSYKAPLGQIFYETRPRVVCKDGYSVSIQVGYCMYCEPRIDAAEQYTSVELGFPNREDELINLYADGDDYTRAVYGYVPVEVVDKLLEKHGGIDRLNTPCTDLYYC